MASSGSDSNGLTDITDTTSNLLLDNPIGRAVARVARWVLFAGDRWVVTAGLTSAVFVLTLLVGLFGPVSVRSFLGRGVSPAQALLELLKGIVTIVTIVLSVNQLVLSPELGPASAQQESLEDALDLRKATERRLYSEVSPMSPGPFLRAVADVVAEDATRLRELVDDRDPSDGDILAFADETLDDAESTSAELSDARYREFEVVPAAMRFATSGKITTARRLRGAHADALSESQREALDEFVERLKLFATARAYFKTTYIRSEYISFSQALLLLGLPCLLGSFYATQIYHPGVFPGETLGVDNGLWFVSAAVTVTLVPFTVLIAYVSRLATVSQSMLFIGPFTVGRDGSDDESGNAGAR